MTKVYVLPAYGRKYSNIDALLKDWNTGKDFRLETGEYCSIRDYEEIEQRYWAEDVVLACPIGNVGKVIIRAKVTI